MNETIDELKASLAILAKHGIRLESFDMLLRAHAAKIEECEELRRALVASMIALDDWLNTYASDMCDAKRVMEAQSRIDEYGTIGYIAHVQESNRSALKEPQ